MATGNSRRGVNRFMAYYGWDQLFDASFCADDGPSKPHPHMVLENLKAVGLKPDQAVMIGDTSHDIHTGRAAKVKTIAVTWGFHTRDELLASEPDIMVDDFKALESALIGAI